MSSNDDTLDSSDRDEQPFHSTPVKAKLEFVSDKLVVTDDLSSDGDTSEQTPESQDDRTTPVSSQLSSSSFNYTRTPSVSSSRNYDISRTRVVHTSAWEQWLLRKEQQRRNHLYSQAEHKRKQTEEERRFQEAKIVQKKIAEEKYQKWLHKKAEEHQRRVAEEQQQKAKKELDSERARQKTTHLTEIQLKKWNECKTKEMKTKAQCKAQKNAKFMKQIEEHKQQSDIAYKQWQKDHRNFKRELYSYGYAGGIIVSYYDATSPPPPTFFNPEPWV